MDSSRLKRELAAGGCACTRHSSAPNETSRIGQRRPTAARKGPRGGVTGSAAPTAVRALTARARAVALAWVSWGDERLAAPAPWRPEQVVAVEAAPLGIP